MSRDKNPEGVRGTRNPNGMGNIYKNKKTGRIEFKRVVHGRAIMATGTTMKIVRERMKDLPDEPLNKEKMRFHDWILEWLRVYIKPFKKASTHDQYEDTFYCYIKPNSKNSLIRAVFPKDIMSIIATMHEKGLSANTMKQVVKVLRLAFKKAVKEKYIDKNKNPMDDEDIVIPAVQQKPRKVLKLDEIQKVLDYLENSRWYWPLIFMMVTGLRRGETLGLKWSSIDYDNKLITVCDNNTTKGMGTEKSNKVHYAALSDTAKKCLDRFKEQLKNENNLAQYKNPDDLIFVSKQGTALRPHSLNNVFRRIQERAGVMVTPHSMRHSYVYYTKNKLSLSQLKDTLGHEISTSTLDIYGDMLFNSEEVASIIEASFKGVFDKSEHGNTEGPEPASQLTTETEAAEPTGTRANAVEAERHRLEEIDAIASLYDDEIVQEAKYGKTACTAQELAFRGARKAVVEGRKFRNKPQEIVNDADIDDAISNPNTNVVSFESLKRKAK
jgi:integrase